MSLTATSWAWEQDLPSTIKFVLVALCDRHNAKRNACFPSHAKLMKRTGLSESAVKKAIRFLDRMGFLDRTQRIADNGRTTSVSYTLAFQSKAETSETSGHEEQPLEASTDPLVESTTDPLVPLNRNNQLEMNFTPTPAPQTTPAPQGAPRKADIQRSSKAPRTIGGPLPQDWLPKQSHLIWMEQQMVGLVFEGDDTDPVAERSAVRGYLTDWFNAFVAYYRSVAHSRRQGWRADWDAAFSVWIEARLQRWLRGQIG